MDRNTKTIEHLSKNEPYFCDLQSKVKIILSFWIKNNSCCVLQKDNRNFKVDYFVPLNAAIPECDLEELLLKVSFLMHIRCVKAIDARFLCIELNRAAVYKSVLIEVANQPAYGMLQLNRTALVLTCDAKCDLHSKRNSIISDHVISLLCSNGVHVFHMLNDSRTKFHSREVEIECSHDCKMDKIDFQLLENAKVSPYCNSFEDGTGLFDVQRFVQEHGLEEKYSKISVPKQNLGLGRAAKLKHIIDEHMHKNPDLIIHVADHSSMNSILQAGLMLKMLDNLDSEQVHIFSQSVKYLDNCPNSFDKYVLLLRNRIEDSLVHKYGPNVNEDPAWVSRISRLVESTIKLDFLKSNPNVRLSLKSTGTNDKNNGVFVQYNYARLSNLFRNFESKVEEGYYFPLPCVEEVDFSLLTLDEEFNIFHYVMTFPNLVEKVLRSFLSEQRKYHINRVCLMLFEMCNHLSLYYSRIRILGGQQKNLQQQMHARLWLLKGVFCVYQNSFTLLNIEGLDLM